MKITEKLCNIMKRGTALCMQSGRQAGITTVRLADVPRGNQLAGAFSQAGPARVFGIK